MHPTLCTRCKKNVAVVFITKIENGETKNEGLCLKFMKKPGRKPFGASAVGRAPTERPDETRRLMESLTFAYGKRRGTSGF